MTTLLTYVSQEGGIEDATRFTGPCVVLNFLIAN
jgi:hypothetical protein